MKILIALLGGAALLAGVGSSSTYQANAQSSTASSSDTKLGIGLGVGTTGATIEAKFAPNNFIALRGSFNYLEFSTEEEYDGITYDGDLDLTTFGGFVDIAPFKNGFVLSGGAFLGDKTFNLLATPSSSVQIGDQSFTPSEVGTLTGQAELKSFSPYAGLGYDGFIAGSKSWSFNARAGVMFTGSPQVDLVSVDGLLSNDPTLRAELDAEIAAIEEEADEYKYYPVVAIGLTRRF